MAKVLHGDANGNQLNASENKTQVYGLKGNDTLISDGKSDVLLIGGSGDDSLIMLGGNGSLSGGDGSDVFELNYSADKKISAVIEDLDPSEDKIVVKFEGSTIPQLTSSVSDNDVVWKDSDGNFNVTLKSVRENDYFDDEASDEVWEVLELTNAEREARNLSPLTMSDGLTSAAEIRVQEITELGEKNELDILKHIRPNRPDDDNNYDTVNYDTVFEEVGKKYHNHAENITAGESTAKEAVDDWMNSPTHRKNILDEEDKNYLKLGVGYNFDDTDPSDQRFYWLQLFADSLNSDSLGNPETVTAEELLSASIESVAVTKFIAGTDESNTIENNLYGATILALGGNDSINNAGLNVSISGGADDDTIDSNGSFGTINAGTGNDQINLNDAQEILIEYFSGDGSDTISGLNSTDTLSISGSEFTPATVGNDIIVGVGSDSITLSGAASSGVQILGTRSKLIIGTQDADNLSNSDDGATILAKGGDDYIYNSGSNVSISAGADDDYIYNSGGENVLFFHDSGNDTIGGFNETSTLKISGGTLSSVTNGNHLILLGSTDSITILDAASFSSINILDANDNPVIISDAKNIVGTEQADNLRNVGDGATIRALGGDDTIDNSGDNVSIFGGAGNDSINNNQNAVRFTFTRAATTLSKALTIRIRSTLATMHGRPSKAAMILSST